MLVFGFDISCIHLSTIWHEILFASNQIDVYILMHCMMMKISTIHTMKCNNKDSIFYFVYNLQIKKGLRRMTTVDHSIYMRLVDQIGKWSIFGPVSLYDNATLTSPPSPLFSNTFSQRTQLWSTSVPLFSYAFSLFHALTRSMIFRNQHSMH